MARTATRTVTVKKRAETASIELRAGETTLGALRGVAGTVGDSATMSGQFTHAPAYVDFTEQFLALATAIREGDAPRAEGERARLEAAGVHVYHAQHEMRIDRPATVHMVGGEIRFTPNDAYLMMRTGGL
jgi:glucose/arabinose dehydrogenase